MVVQLILLTPINDKFINIIMRIVLQDENKIIITQDYKYINKSINKSQNEEYDNVLQVQNKKS